MCNSKIYYTYYKDIIIKSFIVIYRKNCHDLCDKIHVSLMYMFNNHNILVKICYSVTVSMSIAICNFEDTYYAIIFNDIKNLIELRVYHESISMQS